MTAKEVRAIWLRRLTFIHALRTCSPNGRRLPSPCNTFKTVRASAFDRCYDESMIDEELTSPDAFALAVRSRANYLARHTLYAPEELRPYSQLTLLLGIDLDQAHTQLIARGLRGAFRWATS